jgi:methyltransferase (TIGR00027 family)
MKQHETAQYVICGAGMDTFSFRNHDQNLQIYELDHPNTQKYKLEHLNKLGWKIPDNVHYVSVDFSKDNMTKKLCDAGFDISTPAFITILGVTYYLTLDVFEDTIRKFNMITAPGSEIVFDYPDEHSFGLKQNSERYLRLRQITTGLGEIMKQGFSLKEMEDVLKRNDFSITDHLLPAQIQLLMAAGDEYEHVAYENIHLLHAKK